MKRVRKTGARQKKRQGEKEERKHGNRKKKPSASKKNASNMSYIEGGRGAGEIEAAAHHLKKGKETEKKRKDTKKETQTLKRSKKMKHP